MIYLIDRFDGRIVGRAPEDDVAGLVLNGLFPFPIPSGVDIDETDLSLNNLVDQAYNSGLLAANPTYTVSVYDPVLDAVAVTELSLAETGVNGTTALLPGGYVIYTPSDIISDMGGKACAFYSAGVWTTEEGTSSPSWTPGLALQKWAPINPDDDILVELSYDGNDWAPLENGVEKTTPAQGEATSLQIRFSNTVKDGSNRRKVWIGPWAILY